MPTEQDSLLVVAKCALAELEGLADLVDPDGTQHPLRLTMADIICCIAKNQAVEEYIITVDDASVIVDAVGEYYRNTIVEASSAIARASSIIAKASSVSAEAGQAYAAAINAAIAVKTKAEAEADAVKAAVYARFALEDATAYKPVEDAVVAAHIAANAEYYAEAAAKQQL